MKTLEKVRESWIRYEQEELQIVSKTPDILMLEVTNSCNLSCVMCKNPKMKRAKGFVSLELVEKVAQDAHEIEIKKIALYTTGESLLHPKIIDIVKIFKRYGFYVYITTNLTLFDKKVSIEEFLKSGVDSIKYSIDGLNKQEYEAIRINGSYDVVMENMKRIKKVRDSLSLNVKLLMGIILYKNTQTLKEQYRTVYGSYVDDILFSTISNQGGHLKNVQYATNLQDFKPCRQLWDRIVVAYDGKLSTCCIDFDSDLIYADLKYESLESAWNNKKMQSFRKSHLEHDFSNMSLCKGCDSPYIQQTSILEELNE